MTIDADDSRKDPGSLREWLAGAPFGLALSSGYFGFFAHCGLLHGLESQGLRPSRLSGSSAGALIAGLWAAGLDSDDIRRELFELEKTDFWDPALGAGLLRGRYFRDLLDSMLPVQDFAQCRRPLAVSAFDLCRWSTRVLDRGALAPAIHASCALPVLFQPVAHARGWLVDGGVADRPGLAGMPPGNRVLYHHLAARSPWRRENGAHSRLPTQPDLCSLIIEDLPRCGPSALHNGPAAFNQACAATLQALDRPAKAVIRIEPRS